MTNQTSLVEPSLLRRPCRPGWYTHDDLAFTDEPEFVTDGEAILVTDPFYLADMSDPLEAEACAVRENGVILRGFGGDVSCPVWWQPPYLMLPLSADAFPADIPADVEVLSREVGCDSAAFVFLPVTRSLPLSLQRRIAEVVAVRNGALLSLPAGTWSFWYEGLPDRYHRPLRIVGLWEPREPTSDFQLQFTW